ncbi:2-dehydro-3-deoxy-6-phosphogalactonate aldolase [Mesorhizobium sp. SB112]|uniref:2-dehydro-3-deoxy-6-phosphogalactonate aldolase n=1 Tax=Mesorhizobium sp. SB112 TaxID=3151853 RepID=UPI0032637FD0
MSTRVEWPNLKRNLVAILRGVKPDEVLVIGNALVEAGFEAVEVPLNSPDPLESIRILSENLPDTILVGGGTMLSVSDVEAVRAAGGKLMVSPNVVPAAIIRAGQLGMVTMPGVFTPSEAFQALEAGASGLKFFPASALGADGIAAVRSVLPKDTIVGAVGGVSDGDFARYAKAGVNAFGLGSSLYKAGFDENQVRKNAISAVQAYDAVFG